MKEIQKQVGSRIRELREAKGLSQEALAAVCELHRTYVGLIERGERNLSLTTVESIAEGLGVPVAEIFRGQGALSVQQHRQSKKPRTTLSGIAAQVAAIRQVLIDAKITDAKRYEDALRRTRS